MSSKLIKSHNHLSPILSSEKRFELLVTSISDYAIYLLDPNGNIVSWNAGAQRFKGYCQDEILGKHFSCFFTQEDLNKKLPWTILDKAAKVGRFEAEGWRIRKDGTRFRCHAIIDSIHNDNKELIGFAKITRDITEKYNTEEALAKANANAALFQMQKMEAMGKLTGGIAHDFNNLLSVISSGLEVFGLSPIDARQVKMLESMQRAITKGAALTQQLLSFARQQPLKAEAHNVNKLINSFEPMLAKAVNSSIELTVNLSPKISYVKIDVSGFEASLLNLIVNARDAIPQGGVIKLRTEEVKLAKYEIGSLREGSYVKVSVEDNGTGISSEALPHILEPFFTTKEVGKGIGLGLSQVYGFIMQSGGDIAIDTQVGKGTIISLYLPIIKSSKYINTLLYQENLKALLVDDEPDLLIVASELFKSMGYTVLTSSSAEEAMEKLWHTEGVSVLFTDILMPGGMNGIELAHEVHQFDPEIKIILASSYPLSVLTTEHGSIDEFNFLRKPYRLADIAKCLISEDVAPVK